MSLAALFDSLAAPAADNELPSFSTVLIGGGPHRLGRDAVGAPALLVSLVGPTSGGVLAPVELQHVAVQHRVRCRLWRAGGEGEEAVATVIRCRETDRVLRDYFLGVIEGVLPLLGPEPSESRAREVVSALIELFRALELPSHKSVQGLWGELYVIAQAADPTALVACWHAVPGEPYDFSCGPQRLEVKSASGLERRHHFTLVQLHPPAGTAAVIASVFVERAGGGTSLAELLERVRLAISGSSDLVARVDQVVAATLGQGWRNALSERFDAEKARESLAFFDATMVPSIPPSAVPAGVTEVRFKSDLSRAQPLAEAALREREGLFQAVLPLRGGGRR